MQPMTVERLTDATSLLLTLAAALAISFVTFDPLPRVMSPPEPSAITLTMEVAPASAAPSEAAPPPPLPQPIVPPRPVVTDEPPIEALKPKHKPIPPKPLPAQTSTAVVDGPPAAANSVGSAQPAAVEGPPSPPSAPPTNPAVGIEAAYVGELRAYLDSVKRYPNSKDARLLHPQGAAEVRFTLDRNGEVSEVVIARSSNSLVLDQEALATVRGGTYRKFPEAAWVGEGRHVFTITIQFTPHN
jgi:protein TonB